MYIQFRSKNPNKLAKILEPSKGGIGMRLNKPKTKFKLMVWISRPCPSSEMLGSIRKTIAATIASKKLVAGPASDTKIIPHLRLRKFRKSTGTGLAAPKRMGELTNSKNAGNKIEPNKSMCGTGFKVSRPASRAVVSPSLSAISPWAIS